MLRRSGRHARARQLELVERPYERLEGELARRRVEHHVARVLDAHEDTFGYALACPFPVGSLGLIAQPDDLRTTRHSIQKGDISVAELAETALERGQATPSMAQIIVELSSST